MYFLAADQAHEPFSIGTTHKCPSDYAKRHLLAHKHKALYAFSSRHEFKTSVGPCWSGTDRRPMLNPTYGHLGKRRIALTVHDGSTCARSSPRPYKVLWPAMRSVRRGLRMILCQDRIFKIVARTAISTHGRLGNRNTDSLLFVTIDQPCHSSGY